MKIREVTKEKWEEANEQYRERAKELTAKAKLSKWEWSWFYSHSLISCKYSFPPTYKIPLTYKSKLKESVLNLSHFSDRQCKNLPMNIKVICLCEKVYNDKIKYYIGEHGVGWCPHKTK